MKINSQNKLSGGKVTVFKGTDTFDTVNMMIKLIRESKTKLLVRETVENIIRNVPERNWQSEIRAIYDYVQSNIRYTQDVENVETLKTPERLLQEIEAHGNTLGDCDDFTMLLGALLVTAGYNVRLVIVKINTDEWSHIYLHVKIPRIEKWVALDAIKRDEPMGWEVKYSARRVFDV